MTTRRLLSLLGLIFLAVLTWIRWPLISAATVSLAGFILISLRDAAPAHQFWSSSLIEYWVALVAWWVTAAALLRGLLRPSDDGVKNLPGSSPAKKSPRQASLLFLYLMAIVGFCTPFLVPIDPTAQGDLVTTRLVPPLTRGTIRVRQVETHLVSEEVDRSLDGKVRLAIGTLLRREYDLRGISSDARVQVSKGDPPAAFCFLFGSDDVGRDVFSRVIAGARVSLMIGGSAAIGAVFLGVLVGFVAGMSRRIVDSLLMRLTDLFLAIPSIILVIGLVAFLGQSIFSLVAVLSLTGWMSTARIVRAEVHVLREKEFIAAARLLGTSPYRIMVGHLLPNVWPILAASSVLQFGSAMLGEAALSFLGLGIQSPTASWGNMIGESISYVSSGWWVGLFPGLLLSGAVLATHALVEE